jgi:hypothetical protein
MRGKIDRPLKTRECADWMGVRTRLIVDAINDGELEAEDVTINGRRMIRIWPDQFVEYLKKIRWSRLPRGV